MKPSRHSFMLALVLSLPLAYTASASAQAEPTIDQVYQAAKAGRMSDADRMIEEVLAKHPNSAKAHFVKAELAARESNAAVARAELAMADKLAPGLPFAKPEAVQALRSEVGTGTARRVQPPATAQPQAVPAVSEPRHLPLATIAVVFALLAAGFYFFVRRRNPVSDLPAGQYASQPMPPAGPVGGVYPASGMSGGMPGAMSPGMQPGYGPGYAPGAGYPQPQQPGLGSTLGRGLAGGLAMGAGMVAAQEIGHRLFDQHGQPLAPTPSGVLPESDRGLLDPGVNADSGGQDFGINDAGSWDSASDADVSGGDWDS